MAHPSKCTPSKWPLGRMITRIALRKAEAHALEQCGDVYRCPTHDPFRPEALAAAEEKPAPARRAEVHTAAVAVAEVGR